MIKATITRHSSTEAAERKTRGDAAKTRAERPRGKPAPTQLASITPSVLSGAPPSDAVPTTTPKPPRQTKAALVRELLAAPGGVSLAALIEATGWQAHTLRATLSGLRKEGLTLTRRREGENTIYAIAPGGAGATDRIDTVGTMSDAMEASDATGEDDDAAKSEDNHAVPDATAASRLTGGRA